MLWRAWRYFHTIGNDFGIHVSMLVCLALGFQSLKEESGLVKVLARFRTSVKKLLPWLLPWRWQIAKPRGSDPEAPQRYTTIFLALIPLMFRSSPYSFRHVHFPKHHKGTQRYFRQNLILSLV